MFPGMRQIRTSISSPKQNTLALQRLLPPAVETAYVYNKGLLVNGYTTDVDAYTINSNTYFKLRDLATLVDAYVYYDAGSKEIYVVTEM